VTHFKFWGPISSTCYHYAKPPPFVRDRQLKLPRGTIVEKTELEKHNWHEVQS